MCEDKPMKYAMTCRHAHNHDVLYIMCPCQTEHATNIINYEKTTTMCIDKRHTYRKIRGEPIHHKNINLDIYKICFSWRD